MLAALTMLMAGQVANSHLTTARYQMNASALSDSAMVARGGSPLT
ncbi:hypothetical protein [Methylobacterium sp. J-030]|nr:hypothetical protein [Methylobacterium sp. J-030]